MIIQPEDYIKIGVAILVGGIIGAERERHKKAVGLRTLILISMGSAIFTILSIRIGMNNGGETTRIAANIVVGIGFLGAGVILEEKGRIIGLTTAATTWLVAALGMTAGAGEYWLAMISTFISILVLVPLSHFENLLEISNEQRTYEITTVNSWEKYKEIKDLLTDNKMTIGKYKQEKRGKKMVLTFDVEGQMKKHDKLLQKFLSDNEISELWF